MRRRDRRAHHGECQPVPGGKQRAVTGVGWDGGASPLGTGLAPTSALRAPCQVWVMGIWTWEPRLEGGERERSPVRVGCQWSWAINTPLEPQFPRNPQMSNTHTHTHSPPAPQKNQARWSAFIPGSGRHKATADGARKACREQPTASCKPGPAVPSGPAAQASCSSAPASPSLRG